MNKPHSKNFQNIEKNKTAKFGVYIISAAEVEKKLLNIWIVIKIYRCNKINT